MRIAAAVTARYSAPESTWAYPSSRATHSAVEDFPDAAGPSIATTANFGSGDDMGQVAPETRVRHGNAILVVDAEVRQRR